MGDVSRCRSINQREVKREVALNQSVTSAHDHLPADFGMLSLPLGWWLVSRLSQHLQPPDNRVLHDWLGMKGGLAPAPKRVAGVQVKERFVLWQLNEQVYVTDVGLGMARV